MTLSAATNSERPHQTLYMRLPRRALRAFYAGLQSAESQPHYSIRRGQNVGINQVTDHICLITFDVSTCTHQR
jgi:hypothetical protein